MPSIGDRLNKLWSIHPSHGILLSSRREGTADAGSDSGNLEGIVLREKINLRRPHTV